MPTARALVTDALDLIAVHAAEEPLTAHQEQQGLRILNDLIQSASLEQFIIYYMPPQLITWSADVFWKTWGPGGDIVTPRPVQIGQQAFREDGMPLAATPLTVLSLEVFRGLSGAGILRHGLPVAVTYAPQFPLGELYLWPVPQEATQVTVYPWQPLQTWPDFDTDLLLPPGYDRYLKAGVACELAPYYDKEPSATVQTMRNEAKNNIKTTNLVIPVLEVPWFADPFNRQSANIYYG